MGDLLVDLTLSGHDVRFFVVKDQQNEIIRHHPAAQLAWPQGGQQDLTVALEDLIAIKGAEYFVDIIEIGKIHIDQRIFFLVSSIQQSLRSCLKGAELIHASERIALGSVVQGFIRALQMEQLFIIAAKDQKPSEEHHAQHSQADA